VGSSSISLPLGPQPSLNDAGGTGSLIGPNNAAGLFPAIQPSASATPNPVSGLRANGNAPDASPVSSSALTLGTRVLPAQVAGLIALALALLLTMTRLSRRRQAQTQAQTQTPKAPKGPEEGPS
jgi:hypothetical protein